MKTIEEFNNRPIHTFNPFYRAHLYIRNSKAILKDAAVEIALTIMVIAAATFAIEHGFPQIAAPLILSSKTYLITRLILPLFDRSFLVDCHNYLSDKQRDITKTLLLGFVVQMIVKTHIFMLAYVIPISAGIILSILVSLREGKASPGRELAKIV